MNCKKHPEAPVNKEVHHHHPYKLTCSVCQAFIGWGKADKTVQEISERQTRLKLLILKSVALQDWETFHEACSLYGLKHLGLMDMDKYNRLVMNPEL
jgi:hypothetical protein